jgi:GNAT superfamily N-acetyltransferase
MTNTAIQIERAIPEQATRLTQIAHAAKSYWGYPAHWIELWHDQLHITPTYIASQDVYVALVDGVILGFYALTGSGEKLQLDHMWVMPVAIRQGIGRAMFEHALHRAVERDAKIVQIEADPNAEGFYQKMGAQTVGEVSYTLEGQRRSLPFMEIVLPPPSPIKP